MQIGKALLRLLASSLLLSCSLLAQQREVAITIDDLPAANPRLSGKQMNELTSKLLATLKQEQVPAIGFVNEQKLYVKGEVDDRIGALRQWVDNGFELGNHTFSHMSLDTNTLQAWEENVVRGETVTSMLLAEKKMKIRYLRHPYLIVGRDLDTRRQAENFLAQRGYKIAPVTMDAWDWMYSGAYDAAREQGDTAMQRKLVDSYLEYTNQVFDYYEKFSKQFLGYEPKQVLLLHCNWLEAEHINELIATLRKRGYKFVTLDEALTDSAYSLPNTWVGDDGQTWIDQWAITQGKIPTGQPEFPRWVEDISEKYRKSGAQPY
ncbi:polysaccharide deacetylase family protein [Candidatus Korobacter versatilis]|nr:polysaccharide deacetylase family protein [Candidatus Koribacter versatilis]